MVACGKGRTILWKGNRAGESGREEVQLVSIEELGVLERWEGLGCGQKLRRD